MLRIASLVLALPLLAAPLAHAAQTASAQSAEDQAATPTSLAIHLDPAHTQITFSAGTLRHVRGTVTMKGGIFGLNTTTGIAQGEVLIDAASEKSNDAAIDKKLHAETLDVEKFPTILFDPEKVTGKLPAENGQAHLSVAGTMTIHGQDHPLTLDVLATRNGPHVQFQTQFTIPYVKWGMKDASTFFMRDRNIRVTVDTHGVLEGSTAGEKSKAAAAASGESQ